MLISKDDPDYVFEEYKDHIIATHKDNVAEKSLKNDILVFDKRYFPENGFIVGLDDSKLSGGRESFPVNIDDAKGYIDWVVEVRRKDAELKANPPKVIVPERQPAEEPSESPYLDPRYRGEVEAKLVARSANSGGKAAELPAVNIEGTEFIVDVSKLEFREKGNEANVIYFKDLDDTIDHTGYELAYSINGKGVSPPWDPGPWVSVIIPDFVRLDPQGMARKYNLSLDELSSKTDCDLMVDHEALNKRLNHGQLPAIDVMGHTFYVDLRLGMLRPKDDFLSEGIVFDKIEHYYSVDENVYLIPYNPKTRAFQELDWNKLTSIPKDLTAVQFPGKFDLDPIGWNRIYGQDLKAGLRWSGINLHFTAKVVPWEMTGLPEVVERNLEALRSKMDKSAAEKIDRQERKSKGRGM